MQSLAFQRVFSAIIWFAITIHLSVVGIVSPPTPDIFFYLSIIVIEYTHSASFCRFLSVKIGEALFSYIPLEADNRVKFIHWLLLLLLTEIIHYLDLRHKRRVFGNVEVVNRFIKVRIVVVLPNDSNDHPTKTDLLKNKQIVL